MKLEVYGTGSAGNTYALRAGDSTLILDAGIPYKRVLPKLGGLRGVCAVLVTHEHGDHAAAVKDWLFNGVNVLATEGTAKAMFEKGYADNHPSLRIVNYMDIYRKKGWTIIPFPTQHDAEQPCGFLIRYDPTGETVLYATDTYYLRNRFPAINYWIVECNYCDDITNQMVEDGKIEKSLRDRLLTSHMSLRRLKDTLAANDLTQTRKIILVHLSDERSDEERMVAEVWAATGKETVAASNGMTIQLDLAPF